MAKFIFKLQSLLNLKIQIEDSVKNELGKALKKLDREKKALERLEKMEEDSIFEFNHKAENKITVEKLREHTSYISSLREKIALQKENVNFAQFNVDKVREKLIKIVQEREMLDKLKEKRYQEFLEEQSREDQRLNDEIVSYKQGSVRTGDKDG